MNPLPDRRRSILVDRRFQFAIVSRLAVILAANAVLFFALAIGMPAAIGYLSGFPSWGILELFSRVELLAFAVLLPMACTFFCLMGQGLRETLRIAGPEFRFRQVFRQLKQLRLPRGVQIRKEDHLQTTSNELHQCLVALHDEVAQLQLMAREAAASESAQALARWRKVGERLERFTLQSCAPECRPLAAETASTQADAPLATVGAAAHH